MNTPAEPPAPKTNADAPGFKIPGAIGVLVLLVALALLLPATLRTSEPPAQTDPPVQTEAPEESVSVLETGATPDDDEDDLAAFEEAVERARAEDRPVAVPSGTFELSDVLVLDGVAMQGAGRDSTRLVSTDPLSASIRLTGEQPSLAQLEHAVPDAEGRSPEPGRQNVRVEDATSFYISSVHLVGAKGGGILVRDSHHGLIQDSIVEQTLADGIHMTEGTTNILVRRNFIQETGDDGIAVVSYKSDGTLSGEIEIRDNYVARGEARGITVVGGEQVDITDNEVVETESGGIYIAAEKEWETFGVQDVSVTGNRVSGAPTRNSHASVLVYSSEMLVDDVRFRGNTVLGSTTTGFGSWTNPDLAGEVGDLSYEDNRVAESADSLWAPTALRAGSIDTSDNVGF